MKSWRILAFGEVLWDLLPAGETFGGAPANLAGQAALLGLDVALLSAVGCDLRGAAAIASLQRSGVQTALIQTTPDFPTGTVGVSLDSAGKPSGAGPLPGNTAAAELTTNSNFRIDMTGLTQFGGDFSVQSNTQNGFAKGQLTGLDVNDRGAIFARFSNGQSKILGEVALADFADQSKLANAGGSRFSETAASGSPAASGAGTAGLGVIQSGALEDSNVDLSEQLVQLIVSQRNFQAAAQIIESADTATQTIINL